MKAVFSYGRMNPPTIGHQKLVKKLVSVAKAQRAKPLLYLSHTQNSKKDPLSYSDKIRFAKKSFPQIDVVNTSARTIIEVLKELEKKGFTDLTLVVGSDRVREFDTLVKKYNGKEYTFDSIKVVSAGARDPDSEGVEGMSASKLRQIAISGMEDQFKIGLPEKLSDSDKTRLYNLVRKGLNVSEEKIDEAVLTLQQRLKRARTMKRLAPRFQKLRKIKRKMMADPKRLMQRARKQAINFMRKRMAGDRGAGYAGLSPAAKISIDKLVDKKRPAIEKLAKRLLPKVRKSELERVRKARTPKNEATEVPQDQDVKQRAGSQPAKYYKGLSKSTKKARDTHFDKYEKKPDDDPSAYKPAPGDKGAKTKPSVHTKKFKQMFGENYNKWLNKEPVEYSKHLEKTFGKPDELTNSQLCWFAKDGFKRIVIKDEYILHSSPAPHYDFIYCYIDLQVPKVLADDLAMSSGSILIDFLKGEVGARCSSITANATTLNYVMDVVSGRVRPSKQEYERRILEMKQMFEDGEKYSLEWWSDETNDADPNNPYYSKSVNESMPDQTDDVRDIVPGMMTVSRISSSYKKKLNAEFEKLDEISYASRTKERHQSERERLRDTHRREKEQMKQRHASAIDRAQVRDVRSEEYIEEGVNDPSIFKAVFLAGGPGSGKSFIVGQTALIPLGFKLINSDNQFERALKKAGLDKKKPEDIFSPKGQQIRIGAKELTARQMNLAIDGRLGLVIDGTGKEFDKIKKQDQMLKELGYETAMIFVNTDLDTAQRRNKERSRVLPEDEVETMWNQVQSNFSKYQTLYRRNFFNVDNSDGADHQTQTKKVYNRIKTWAATPPKNPIATSWIQDAQKAKTNEEFELFQINESFEEQLRQQKGRSSISPRDNYTLEEKSIAGLKKKSDKSGVPYSILKKVYDRGMAAWKTGHRPGTTPQQWAFARVNSFLTGGKTRTTADKDLWAKASAAKKSKKEAMRVGPYMGSAGHSPYPPGMNFESVDQTCPRTKADTCQCESINQLTEADEPIHATVELIHSDKVKGTINLTQEPGGPTKITGTVTGLEPGMHGFHIHEFGDLSDGCKSAGAHYNPTGVDHGDVQKGHVGDLGNISANDSGTANINITAPRVNLHGDQSVIGRSVVIHSEEDDLGKGGDPESLKTGNAGDRLACGVISIKQVNESLDEAFEFQIAKGPGFSEIMTPRDLGIGMQAGFEMHPSVDEQLSEDWFNKLMNKYLLKPKTYQTAKQILKQVIDRKKKEGPLKHSIEFYAQRIAQNFKGVDARELAKMATEEYGAGEEGSDQLVKKYVQDTPHMEIQREEEDWEEFDAICEDCMVDLPLLESEYQGEKVTLNDPIRSSKGPKKFHVYVKNDKGNVVKVNFGDPNLSIKRDDPDRRRSFRARHNCDNPGPKWKARYWSCRMWTKSQKVSDLD